VEPTTIVTVTGVLAAYALACRVAPRGIAHLLVQGLVLLGGMIAMTVGLTQYFERVQQELPGTPATIVLILGGMTAIGAVVVRTVVRSALREDWDS
jgi:ABC-type spermidine/putrescine transport system permease subunit II